MAGPWSYDLTLLTNYVTAVIAQISCSAFTATNSDVQNYDPEVTAEITVEAFAPITAGMLLGPWNYDLVLKTNNVNAIVANISVEALSDIWELVASDVSAFTYEDSRMVPGVTYQYRVIDANGNVLYSNTVVHPGHVDAVVAEISAIANTVLHLVLSTGATVSTISAYALNSFSTSSIPTYSPTYAIVEGVAGVSVEAGIPTHDARIPVVLSDIAVVAFAATPESVLTEQMAVVSSIGVIAYPPVFRTLVDEIKYADIAYISIVAKESITIVNTGNYVYAVPAYLNAYAYAPEFDASRYATWNKRDKVLHGWSKKDDSVTAWTSR